MTGADLRAIRGLILDMDGVLWRADQPLGDLPAIFTAIRKHGCRVVLATNNSTHTVDQYLKKLLGFGVSLQRWQVINSSEATAAYLQKKFPQGGNVFVIGEEGLLQALAEHGFQHDEQDALAVVAGMDRGLSYEKLSKATLLIRAGVPFIGTNPDRTFPVPYGLVPGAGAILAALEVATDVKPFIVGKPAVAMYEVALDRLDSTPETTLVVGDRLETDIAGGQALGCLTGLVLSGVTTQEQAAAWQPPPTLIAENLTALLAQVFDHARSAPEASRNSDNPLMTSC